MSAAREAFFKRLAGVRAASQAPLLLGPIGASDSELQAARLLRNGLSVTAFAVLEGFLKERTREVTDWLTARNLPHMAYPQPLRDAVNSRGLKVLAALQQRDPTGSDFTNALVELGDSWLRASAGGAWRLPHAALLWPQSNLKAAEALDILGSLGAVTNWGHLSSMAQHAGFTAQPSVSLFNDIASRRNSSAHDATYDADLVTLRAVPLHLAAFAYSFDACLSVAARAIAAGALPLLPGPGVVTLTRLDQAAGAVDEWDEFHGVVPNPTVPVSGRHSGSLSQILQALLVAASSPQDVIVVREWDGIQHNVASWHTAVI